MITTRKSTSFLTDSGISAGFFQYPLKLRVLNSPYLAFSWNWVVIKMRLVSIILKEIKSGWIRKYQVLLFFMLRQLKTTDSLINSDEVAWNLAISEANLCRGSTKHSFYKTFLKNFVKFTEKDLCQSLFFKTFCNFKRRLWHKCFPLNSEIFKKHCFCKMPSGHCFCSLKNHSESIQNLPLECCYNNLKTPAKKFVLVKFQTCIGNWPF